MNKPTWPGNFDGQEYYDAGGKWVWQCQTNSPPRFSVNGGPYGATVASGLTRDDAATLAGLLLKDPNCNSVNLVQSPPPGEWVFERLPPTEPTSESAPSASPELNEQGDASGK